MVSYIQMQRISRLIREEQNHINGKKIAIPFPEVPTLQEIIKVNIPLKANK